MSFLFSPIITILINGLSLYVVTHFVDGVTFTGGLTFFVVGAIVMGVLNSIVKPLLNVIALPFVFLTSGLFLIVINIGLLWFFSYFLDVAAFRDTAIAFESSSSYAIGAIVFGAVNWVASFILK